MEYFQPSSLLVFSIIVSCKFPRRIFIFAPLYYLQFLFIRTVEHLSIFVGRGRGFFPCPRAKRSRKKMLFCNGRLLHTTNALLLSDKKAECTMDTLLAWCRFWALAFLWIQPVLTAKGKRKNDEVCTTFLCSSCDTKLFLSPTRKSKRLFPSNK